MTVRPSHERREEHSHEGEHREGKVHVHEHTKESWLPLAISGVAILLGLASRYLQGPSLLSDILLIGAMIISGYKLAETGLRSLFRGNITINLLITLAATGGFAIGHLEEGAAVIFLFNIAEKLEDYAADRARRSIEALMELKPEVATIRKEGEERTVPVEEVWPGEVFVVRPGDRMPLDGMVVEGVSSVNQATITGESAPVAKEIGEEVYAGTINLDGFLAVKVTKIAGETVLDRILQLVEEAEESRSPTEAFVDRFARVYTPVVIALAILVAVVPPFVLGQSLHNWIYKALVMLVVACPCALAISTPVAMVSAIASAGRNGVLVKGSTFIEQVSNTKAIAFDKTGTLTQGELGVTDIISPTLPERELLRRAVALEAKAEHPIARAILERARAEGVEVSETTDFKAYAGRGVEACIEDRTCCIGNLRLFEELGIKPLDGLVEKLEAEGKTVVLVSEDDCAVGAIALMDKIREGAVETIRELKGQGVRVEMLTGDNEVTARAIAEKLDMDGYKAHLLPEEKVDAIEKIRSEYGLVAMVGDGVNDAPALAAADVGIAMGAIGSDVALETADIALMEDELSRITYLVKLSKATMGRIRENIAASLLVKLVVAALAFPGLVTLWIAVAVGDMGLSLAVIFNSLRLGRIRSDKLVIF
ncbi:MAG: cadmium-translocating P-type ATPase [Candidatus Bathyarchaeota archaeon]|nr:MAG: cadmium-translocating P-type ATPase [Candidatus Bathyarchaeota archaeon]